MLITYAVFTVSGLLGSAIAWDEFKACSKSRK